MEELIGRHPLHIAIRPPGADQETCNMIRYKCGPGTTDFRFICPREQDTLFCDKCPLKGTSHQNNADGGMIVISEQDKLSTLMIEGITPL